LSSSLYETLEINKDASANEIKRAYKKMARKYHPDLNKDKDAEDKFKEINAAYEILSDESKKEQYDMHGDSMFGGQKFQDFARSTGGNDDLNDILRQMFSGGGGFGGSGFGGGGFGGAGFGNQSINLDLETSITVPFVVSIIGGKHAVSINKESFDIKIPAGIKSNEVMRVRGKGKVGHRNEKGDLLLRVIVAELENYQRDGDTLIQTVNVSLNRAIFGGKVEIETLEKVINLKVPQDTKMGQKFRVKNQGATNRKTKIRGDLYLKVNIVLPKAEDLDSELAQLMKEKLPN